MTRGDPIVTHDEAMVGSGDDASAEAADRIGDGSPDGDGETPDPELCPGLGSGV